MNVERVTSPETFINSFSFHDVRIDRMEMDFGDQALELHTPDLNWNYEVLPDYVERSCILRFIGVVQYKVDLADVEGVRINEINASQMDGSVWASIYLNLGGGERSWGDAGPSICLRFSGLEIVDH